MLESKGPVTAHCAPGDKSIVVTLSFLLDWEFKTIRDVSLL